MYAVVLRDRHEDARHRTCSMRRQSFVFLVAIAAVLEWNQDAFHADLPVTSSMFLFSSFFSCRCRIVNADIGVKLKLKTYSGRYTELKKYINITE